MKTSSGGRLAACVVASCALLHTPTVLAQEAAVKPGASEGYQWELMLSPYAHHWTWNEDHRHVYLIGLERHQPDNWLWGAGLFSNSFGQPTGYVYYGYEWNDLFGVPRVFFKLAAGIMYGYVGQYQDKVPLNYKGFSPIIVPALGYRLTPQDAVQIAPLGKAGVLFSYNRRF